MPELKPCPFCGERLSPKFDLIEFAPGKWDASHFCPCSGDDNYTATHAYGNSAEEAIARWNSRADLTPLGRWEPFRRKYAIGSKCSVCGFTHYPENNDTYVFCPGCGAKMGAEG